MYIYNVYILPFLHIYINMYKGEYGTDRKYQLPVVCLKWKMETANCLLFAANGNEKRKFACLQRQR